MSEFNGFQIPNFTQVPNEYLDYTISSECQLSKTQMRIMNLFFRETFGWQDKNKSIILSFNDILAILGLTKKNTVIDALKGLVEDEKFLEWIQVCDLPESVRHNIEVSLDRTLQPKQKLYRLNLSERKNKSWDFAERTHINVKERKVQSSNQKDTTFESSNQKDTTTKSKKVTTTKTEKVTTLEPESFEALSVEPSLNKGLNKDLNKREEEEEAHAILHNPSLKLLNDLAITSGFDAEVAMEIGIYVNDKKINNLTEAVILKAFEEVQADIASGFAIGHMAKWTAGKIEKVSKRKNLNVKPSNPKQPEDSKKPKVKYGTDPRKLDFSPRKEILTDWAAADDQHVAENTRINEEQISSVQPDSIDQLMAFNRIIQNFKDANAGKRNTLFFNDWLEDKAQSLNVDKFDFVGIKLAERKELDKLLGIISEGAAV